MSLWHENYIRLIKNKQTEDSGSFSSYLTVPWTSWEFRLLSPGDNYRGGSLAVVDWEKLNERLLCVCLCMAWPSKHFFTKRLLFPFSCKSPSFLGSSRPLPLLCSSRWHINFNCLTVKEPHVLRFPYVQVCFSSVNLLFCFNLVVRSAKEPRKVEGKFFLPDASYIASAFIICSFVLLMTLSSTYVRMQVITQNNSVSKFPRSD